MSELDESVSELNESVSGYMSVSELNELGE